MAETKQFTRFEKSQIINTAKVLKGFFAKKDSLEKKINELKQEMLAVDEQQKRWEAPIMDLLGGHRLEEVVEYKKELQPAASMLRRFPCAILKQFCPLLQQSLSALPTRSAMTAMKTATLM